MKDSPICFGSGLIALDVILNGNPNTLPKFSAGGSCGNVLTILAYLGWESFPIGRLSDTLATKELLRDFSHWQVNTKFIFIGSDGTTPIIIHRIMKDKNGNPAHRFEFKDPETKEWLPQFKPITKNVAAKILEDFITPSVFYFDRMNPGTYDLAVDLKNRGAIIFFEPSNAKDINLFKKFLSLTDILKYSRERIPDYSQLFPEIVATIEIETAGKGGLSYRYKNSKFPNRWKLLNGYEMEDIKDTAGAGDWCSAGIITKLFGSDPMGLNNRSIVDIETALNYGQLLGSLNCLYDGARGLMYSYNANEIAKIITEITLRENKNSRFFHDIKEKTIIDNSKSMKISSLYQEY